MGNDCSFRMFLEKHPKKGTKKIKKVKKKSLFKDWKFFTWTHLYEMIHRFCDTNKRNFLHKQTNENETWNKLVYCLCFIRGTDFSHEFSQINFTTNLILLNWTFFLYFSFFIRMTKPQRTFSNACIDVVWILTSQIIISMCQT